MTILRICVLSLKILRNLWSQKAAHNENHYFGKESAKKVR